MSRFTGQHGREKTILIPLYHLQSLRNILIFICNFLSVIKDGSRLAATSKMEAVNYYHKALHPGCCSSARAASGDG